MAKLPISRAIAFVLIVLTYVQTRGQGSGYAVDFDGAGDYIQSSGNYSYTAGNDLTIETWFFHRGTGIECLWYFDNSHYILTSGAGNISVQWGTTNYLIFGFVSLNEWHHLAFTLDGSANTVELILDGILIGTATRTETSLNSDLYLGRYATNTSRDWDGLIDEFRVWSELRTLTEIRDNMCLKLTGSETNLDIYYKLDEGTGTSVMDETSNNQDATKTTDGTWELSAAPLGDTSTYFFLEDLTSPWAGNALDCDGSNDYVSLGTRALFQPTAALTVEAWLYIRDDGSWEAPLTYLQDNGTSESGYGITFNGNTGDLMWWVQTVGNSTNNYGNYPQFTPTLDTWFHFAGTYDGSELKIYVNGVPTDSVNRTGNIDWSPSPLDFRLGVYYDNNENNYFEGTIDEVRLWNVARTHSEIRDNYCQEIPGNSTGLIGYWQLNSSSGTTATDSSTNSNDGTLNNFALSGSTSNWVTATMLCPADFSLVLSSTENDSLSITNVIGNPTAMYIYNVQEYPNDTSGALGVGGNNQYYGVFHYGGTSTSYDATYHYEENDAFQLGGTDESDLALYIRDDNSDITWVNVAATQNMTTNTLVATAQNTEFILGSTSIPLPVTLLDFTATLRENIVWLEWATASEINNDYFIIEKSKDLIVWHQVDSLQGGGNQNIRLEYSTVDNLPFNGTSYYRLKQVDFNGAYTHSEIRVIDFEGGFRIFPNPVKQQLTILSDEEEPIIGLEIYSTSGKLLREYQTLNTRQLMVDVADLEVGILIMKIVLSSGVRVERVVHE